MLVVPLLLVLALWVLAVAPWALRAAGWGEVGLLVDPNLSLGLAAQVGHDPPSPVEGL